MSRGAMSTAVVCSSSWAASLLAVALFGLRFMIDGSSPAALLLLSASAGFLAVGFLACAGVDRAARAGLPTVALLGTFGMAAVGDGFASESLYWTPFVPLVAMMSLGGRAAMIFGALCELAALALLAAHFAGNGGIDDAGVWLRWLGLAGALAFSGLLGAIYERERTRSLNERERARRRTQAIVDNLHSGIIVTDDQSRLIVTNERLCEMFGMPGGPATLAGRPLAEVMAGAGYRPANPQRFRDRVGELVADQRKVADEEITMADGRVFERDYAPLNASRSRVGHLWTFRDVTSHKRETLEIRKRLNTDPLTKLASRRGFDQALARARENAIAGHGSFGLLYIDLDGFKAVNDEHGHAVGDLLLSVIARRMRACVRACDTIGRLGGDEFALLLRGGSSHAVLARVARSLLKTIAKPVVLEGVVVRVSASIGGVVCDPRTAHEDVMSIADAAMYRAKKEGKDRFELATFRYEPVPIRRTGSEPTAPQRIARPELTIVTPTGSD